MPDEIGYFAVEKRAGSLDGVNFDAGSFTSNHTVTNHSYAQALLPGLHLIASIATFNDADPVTVRWTSLGNSSVTAFVDEDISDDSETNHPVETIDYFAINDNSGGAFFLDVPLDIELLSFGAKALAASHVQLKWSTTDRYLPGDHFLVERSNSGEAWSEIASVEEPLRRPQSTFQFEMDDFQSIGLGAFYRLKQVDAEGKTAYSEVQRANWAGGDLAIEVYPNPTVEYLHVHGAQVDGEAPVILDLSGRLLTQQIETRKVGDAEWEMQFSALSSGQYLLRVGGKVFRIVKQ